jgi:archaellum component FlaC|tara:strand:+ start:287 stop:520 length:234 start_codon:yes stop_codon:yes gene_type:complete
MKESKLIKLKNEVKMLTQTVKQLIEDLLKLDSLTRGTLTAFQLHIGEEEWKKVLEELKNIEARTNDTSEKKLDLDDD